MASVGKGRLDFFCGGRCQKPFIFKNSMAYSLEPHLGGRHFESSIIVLKIIFNQNRQNHVSITTFLVPALDPHPSLVCNCMSRVLLSK